MRPSTTAPLPSRHELREASVVVADMSSLALITSYSSAERQHGSKLGRDRVCNSFGLYNFGLRCAVWSMEDPYFRSRATIGRSIAA
jgi:hypothetical protein